MSKALVSLPDLTKRASDTERLHLVLGLHLITPSDRLPCLIISSMAARRTSLGLDGLLSDPAQQVRFEWDLTIQVTCSMLAFTYPTHCFVKNRYL